MIPITLPASLSRVGIIIDSRHPDCSLIEQSLQQLGCTYEILDPFGTEDLTTLLDGIYDCILLRPSHESPHRRQIFAELAAHAVRDRKAKVFPSYDELRIYESKRELAMFLKAKGIPHPETRIFYNSDTANEFAREATYPLVFKTPVGAGGSGVELIETRDMASRMIRLVFGGSYAPHGSSPDRRDWFHGSVLFQKFVPNVREWRIIKIGESWFGHEKMPPDHGWKHSGSGNHQWNVPALRVFDFCRAIAESNQFQTMCFDVFETPDGTILVNELQCWFGSYNPSQMYRDGKPGRYLHDGNEWIFEEGFFNQNGSTLLRIAVIARELRK